MGMPMMSRCSSDESTRPASPNPDPKLFTVMRRVQVGVCVVVEVVYANVPTFEGRKILLFKGVMPETIDAMRVMDPHFCDDEHLSPFARFRPTAEGWQAALALARAIYPGAR